MKLPSAVTGKITDSVKSSSLPGFSSFRLVCEDVCELDLDEVLAVVAVVVVIVFVVANSDSDSESSVFIV